MDSTRCYDWYEAQFLGKIKRIKSETKGVCLAVISYSQPRAVVGGLNWLSWLFVLQFCNVFQLSFHFLYCGIYFLMILCWGVSAKRTESQQQQSIISLLPMRGASEDFTFHTSFTTCGCEAATKPIVAQTAFQHQKLQLAARILLKITVGRSKSRRTTAFVVLYCFCKVSVTAEIKHFSLYEYSLS